MRVVIDDGVRLYVDVDGMGLVPVDGKMVERPMSRCSAHTVVGWMRPQL